jgi:ABC-2 type transport system ATP-binding protein
MRELIRKLKGQHTIVLSTHILPEVQASCDKVIIINRGKIVAEDSLDGLSKRMSASDRGGSHITLRVRRDQEAIATGLKAVDGVRTIANAGNYIEVQTDGNDDTVEAISGFVVKKGAGLVELKVQALALEDIFIKLTSSEGTR